jgi:hypothetical protein
MDSSKSRENAGHLCRSVNRDERSRRIRAADIGSEDDSSTGTLAPDRPLGAAQAKVVRGLDVYFPWNAIGLRGRVRYKETRLNDEDAGDLCLPFSFCQGSFQQIEFAGGAVFRF